MQISFDRLFAKNLQFFFAKLVQSVSLCHRLSKKLNFINIWQVKVGQNKDLVCYRQKQSFRQCAWVRKFQQPAGIIFGSIICRYLFIAYNMEPVNYTLSTFLPKYFLLRSVFVPPLPAPSPSIRFCYVKELSSCHYTLSNFYINATWPANLD